ncbi:MAG: response regulator transcription factor [Dehalococcoidales bacterium]|nr:response regulator transcription factor [Dehalococcoidales bacterium]
MKILVIEDDKSVIDTISLSFKVGWPGTEFLVANDGMTGITLAKQENPDTIILDLVLPDCTGYEVLSTIRSFSNTPVIIVSALDEETDVIKGLEMGADDYLTKPFRKMELLARVKTALRRQSIAASDQVTQVCGALKYLPVTRQVLFHDKSTRLTNTEADILTFLMQNASRVVSHSELSIAVWGKEFEHSANTIKVHIRHLREKLEVDPSHPAIIITSQGAGYSFITPA